LKELQQVFFLGIYDEKTVKIAKQWTIESTFVNFKEYIEFRRNQSNKRAWIEIEKLKNKWNIELQNDSDRLQTGNI